MRGGRGGGGGGKTKDKDERTEQKRGISTTTNTEKDKIGRVMAAGRGGEAEKMGGSFKRVGTENL